MVLMNYSELTYAGVLGKMIGVYLGRPVEGWAYEKIQAEFDEINYYVHQECGVPLVVADDDLSGTFGFFKALKDYDYKELTAEKFGDTWLNYIIEDKTVLWWGGLGRSTEHTAFLRLKNGIKAPLSGSIEMNGSTLAEQIGAQIFIDAIAMACPNDPDRAVELIKASASVSHDGMAVEAACLLGAMEAMAFEEKDINKLLDKGLTYIENPFLLNAIQETRDVCSREKDWRKVREFLDRKYGYKQFPGTCHIVPNHLMLLTALILGEDDFQKSIMIAASAGWDTDCNAGNVGCLNGIRLGLEGISAGPDFRDPVRDLLYVVSADGGSVVTDAVKETHKIIEASHRLKGETYLREEKNYTFDFKGSTQGFDLCPYSKNHTKYTRVYNSNELSDENGLLLECKGIAKGLSLHVSTPVFLEFDKLAVNFATTASPTLYASQKVTSVIQHFNEDEVQIKQYVLYYDIHNEIKRLESEPLPLKKGENKIEWVVPDTEGMSIFRLGYEILSEKQFDGRIMIKEIDWNEAPSHFYQKGMLMTSIWNTNPFWLSAWSSSAKHFAADFKYTYCISHHEKNGVATIGTQCWKDYSVESALELSLHTSAGLILRSNGHRRYYAAKFVGGKHLDIICKKDHNEIILGSIPFEYKQDKLYKMEFSAYGNRFFVTVDGQVLIEVNDPNHTYSCGAAGFIMDEGTMVADGFSVKNISFD
ncbi:ADP-ribosylglycohydrolase family protein [Neobacillus niacini]|uniref:ADP-ribosylglycohydrolase family protein n=1 Tax=Neobacillus niacini TaxID=86668 RepID=UPI00052FD804|nr:ADP-ribosylglycohydrolase family protein [Neobacillus niacini]KGM46154.1 ADP-ribosylglycohydrolase [Neobacillus niacini]MEC1522242.1 ADP-ribosylglycohydrolase family protein [Neobacillus niacini]